MDKVDKTVAEAEFDRFLESMDIRGPDERSGEEERASFDSLRATIIGAMCDGRLVIDESGQPVYSPKIGNETALTFHEPTGGDYMAMDGKKDHQKMARMYAVLGSMTKTDPKRFSFMKARDLKVCTAIFSLFFS